PGEVFRECDVTGTEAPHGAVTEPDLDLTLERDHVLTPGRVVPVVKVPRLGRTEHHALGSVQRREIGTRRRIDVFEVRLSVIPRIETRHAHAWLLVDDERYPRPRRVRRRSVS